MTLPTESRPTWRAPVPRLLALAAAALALHAAAGAPPALAQDAQEPQSSEREKQDLNTIATLSVGLVIQSFGYIGVYGDLLSSGAYESEQVVNMLGDTVKYLTNARRDLVRYQDPGFSLSPGDRAYLSDVAQIMTLLIEEAESLRGFAQSRAEGDLGKFRSARDSALKRINLLIRP
ncbi:MAG: hypothetical protein LBG06_03365 [Deltaproteobacteria bacterium]|jgi:hypothetical protein|nr:hypothetical protein [Deltaproteobacteria bacterium]